MSRSKKRQLSLGKASTSLSLTTPVTEAVETPVTEPVEVTVEYDSCYRGKIEIWKDHSGRVVSQKIIR